MSSLGALAAGHQEGAEREMEDPGGGKKQEAYQPDLGGGGVGPSWSKSVLREDEEEEGGGLLLLHRI